MDNNLPEPDVAKKRITHSKEFFNYMNKKDSKKEDVLSLNARDGHFAAQDLAAPNLKWIHCLIDYLYEGIGREPKASEDKVNDDISRCEVEA